MPKMREFALWAAIVLLAVFFFAWQYAPAQEFDWKYDEGPDTVKASLLLKDYDLYADIWSDHPPLFTVLLAGVFRVFGETLPHARLLVLVFACLGIVSLGVIARLAGGRVGALFAVVAVMLLPHFNGLSRLVMLSLPAISLSLVAIALLALFRARPQPVYLILAGLAYAGSLLIKPLAAPLYLGVSALLLGAGDERPRARRWRDWLLFHAALIAPALAALAIWRGALVEQVVGVFLQARAESAPWPNLGDLTAYLLRDKWELSYAGLIALAGLGLGVLALQRAWAWLAALSLWLGAVAVALLWQTPLRSHELFLVMPPLIVAAAIAVQHAAQGLMQWKRIPALQRGAAILGCLAVIWAGASLPELIRINVDMRATSIGLRNKTPSRVDAVTFIQEHTAPDSTLIADDPMLLFQAGRTMPPSLVVSSYKRIQVGELTPDDLIALTQQSNPPLIAFWRGGFERITAYVDWVRAHYATRRAYEDEQLLYTPRPAAESAYYQPAASDVGLYFWGSEVDRLAAEPGESLRLTLYWGVDRPVEQDYTLFAHLLDANGERLAQADIRPLDEHYRTSKWQPGELIGQEVTLTVPLGAAPGEKVVAVGMRGAGKELIPLRDNQGNPLPDDQVILTIKPVVHWAARYEAPNMNYLSGARMGDIAQLLGFDLESELAGADREAKLTLYWKCLQPTRTSYTVFVHVLDAQGKLAAQRDQRPGDGQFPTTGWAAGEIITDAYTLTLPEDLPVGEYQIIVGMYDLSTGARLAVQDQGQPAGDHILLQTPLRRVAERKS